jgi:hypothetical protein
MSLDNYKRTIEEYIAKKGKQTPSKDTGKGLLAPKSGTKPMSSTESSKKQDDVIANVAEFVYMLRQKRQEIVKGRSAGTKKDKKNDRK